MANKAQVRLMEILDRVPMHDGRSRDQVIDTIRAWEGYGELEYSSPHHQIAAIEKKYGTTTEDIARLYPSMGINI